MENSTLHSMTSTDIFNATEDMIYSTLVVLLASVGILLNIMLIIAYYSIENIKQNQFNFDLMQLSITFVIQGIGIMPYVILDVRNFLSYGGGPVVVYMLCGIKDGIGLFFVAANISFYILCSMTYTRYQLIKHPLRERKNIHTTKRRSNRLFVLFLIISIVLIVPNFITLYAYPGMPFCMRTSLFRGSFLQIYGVCTVFIGYFLPFTLLVVMFVKVIWELHRYSMNFVSIQSNQWRDNQRNFKRHAVRRLAFVVISFLFYWLPLCGWVLGFSGYYDLSVEHQIQKARMYRFLVFLCLFPPIVSVIGHVLLNSRIRRSILTSMRSRMSSMRANRMVGGRMNRTINVVNPHQGCSNNTSNQT